VCVFPSCLLPLFFNCCPLPLFPLSAYFSSKSGMKKGCVGGRA
jgi:hypothetical protein